uniref:Uncharacterized protein n=1 Tax=Rhizophora mucronata TaxID=61149 RepID=A0A2P2KAY1_RHIMU
MPTRYLKPSGHYTLDNVNNRRASIAIKINMDSCCLWQ